jgi:hypothetical protein
MSKLAQTRFRLVLVLPRFAGGAPLKIFMAVYKNSCELFSPHGKARTKLFRTDSGKHTLKRAL